MSDTHDVISAFLDDEPFEPAALDRALADPVGRTLLLDLIALRHASQPDEPIARPVIARAPSRVRLFLAAAAVLVALAGGYQLGQRRENDNNARPPAPTRVVPAAVAWQEVPNGGIR